MKLSVVLKTLLANKQREISRKQNTLARITAQRNDERVMDDVFINSDQDRVRIGIVSDLYGLFPRKNKTAQVRTTVKAIFRADIKDNIYL